MRDKAQLITSVQHLRLRLKIPTSLGAAVAVGEPKRHVRMLCCALLCNGNGEVVAPRLRHARDRAAVALRFRSCNSSRHLIITNDYVIMHGVQS